MNNQELKDAVIEVLEDECYDMTGELSTDDIVKFVTSVVPMRFKIETKRLKVGSDWTYSVKIQNDKTSSYLSLSSDECTGVSRSVYYIFENPAEPTEDEIKTFLDMLNEAWYLCNMN